MEIVLSMYIGNVQYMSPAILEKVGKYDISTLCISTCSKNSQTKLLFIQLNKVILSNVACLFCHVKLFLETK